MIDLHTHILPDVDDGSSSVEESVRMIEMLADQGVNKILLTPHFYAYLNSVERFIEKRDAALKRLTQALDEKKISVELYVGGEILFFEELWRIDELRKFCISGTKLIIIEMPFSSWENSAVDCISKIINKGYVPIIAHVERYLKYSGNYEKLRELFSIGAIAQINSSSFKKFLMRRRIRRIVKVSRHFLLGSDCHNVSSRRPDFDETIPIVKKIFGDEYFEKLIKRQASLMKGAKKVYPLQ